MWSNYYNRYYNNLSKFYMATRNSPGWRLSYLWNCVAGYNTESLTRTALENATLRVTYIPLL
jgi:hypothetical protein